ncbi:radical SAM protein [Salinarimonas ramus]|uniref:Radical SAM core domain-containing protein n=1 Tax=Salinarimonas ramus TaxID=690164 RepID=A0A917Q8F2_9HYPH|nr:radical SAM protein [Salinarimonas ramus]GGK31730.1 hypothetical protein GCM10011322_17910 [Salinarimonas ramus]
MRGETVPALRALRSQVLPLIDPEAQPLPSHPHTAFAWPTRLCSIGCAHCSFGARRTGRPETRRVAEHADGLVEWLVAAKARRLVICGGGEPLDEPAFVEDALRRCAERSLPVELYTAGISLLHRTPAADVIAGLRRAHAGATTPLAVRLSVDAFHEERIGLEPVAQWIEDQERLAPEWRLSLRGIRVVGDGSIERLAARLGAELERSAKGTGWMTLRSGRKLLCEWKGFVLENRGSLDVLASRGLTLPEPERDTLARVIPDQDGRGVGRPFSARLTVTHRRIDLEIHSCGTVNILESQATDLRMRFLDHSWDEMRSAYFRDPLLHRIVVRDLPGIAELIAAARKAGVGGRSVPAFSLQNLRDDDVLNAITALALVQRIGDFTYPPQALEAAQRVVEAYGLASGAAAAAS